MTVQALVEGLGLQDYCIILAKYGGILKNHGMTLAKTIGTIVAAWLDFKGSWHIGRTKYNAAGSCRITT